MNERIKQLWDKAAESTAAFPSGQNNSWETQVNFMNKFAELIIEECGRVADVFCHIWCEEDKPHDVTVSNYIKRHVLRADPE